VVERQSGLVSLKANPKRRGMVIDADTYFPGWVATVDGQPARFTKRTDSCGVWWWRPARIALKCDTGRSRFTGALR
jgi:hypothetical protein